MDAGGVHPGFGFVGAGGVHLGSGLGTEFGSAGLEFGSFQYGPGLFHWVLLIPGAVLGLEDLFCGVRF